MVEVNKLGIILGKSDFDFENEGVLNPGVIREGETTHMFYRAVAKNNYSSIGYCTLNGAHEVTSRNQTPLLSPMADYEKHGMEDPRIVKIDDVYYLTYTAYDGLNALGALATSTDLISWERHGIIVPLITYNDFKTLIETNSAISEKYTRFNQYSKSHESQEEPIFLWDKNLIFFPRKINDKFCFLHRIKPDIQVVVSIEKLEDLTTEFWKAYFLAFNDHVVLSPKFEHEISYVGGGCPPIETASGWLIIYHAVHDTLQGYVYSACAALLDINDPNKEIARLPYPLFFPQKSWELKGEVNNVCFPTGAVLDLDTLLIFYGAADERIALATLSLEALLAELINNRC
ncbi:MAG TPA: pesticidal protein Cry7Aa [Saprospiraceae bacterium]|mgnify:FL=1|nr:pesticidal protein Cry7Aa [Saprospiraceae bacterium]